MRLRSPLPFFSPLAAIAALASPHSLQAQCQSKLFSADGVSGDDFGQSIDVDGDLMAIGAPFHDVTNGAVYFFERQNGEWSEVAKVQASDRSGLGHKFGHDLGLDAGVLLVGTPRDDETVRDSGAAYVYRFDGLDWIEEAKFKAPVPLKNHHFGECVALEGDVAVVGARGDTDAGTLAGAVFVYRYDGAAWSQEAKILASDASASYEFGTSVEIVDGRLMVGSRYRTVAGVTRAGSVYVYEFVSGAWTEQQILEPSDPERNSEFGNALSLFDDVLAVGAVEDDEAAGNAGAVYLYRFQGGAWQEEQKIFGSDTLSADEFGRDLAWNGERLVVGAPFHDDAAQGIDNAGAAYVFKEDGGVWIEEEKLEAFDPAQFNLYGTSVSVDGTDAVVGAIHADTLNDADVGAVYGLQIAANADWENYGFGHPGTLGVPGIALSDDPILGTSLDLLLDNSLGTNTIALLFVGFSEIQVPTSKDGTLFVLPWRIFIFPVPGAGLTLPFDLECDPTLTGISVYLQALEADPGASKGVSFTPGLRMDLGNY